MKSYNRHAGYSAIGGDRMRSCRDDLRQFLATPTPSFGHLSRPVREVLTSIHEHLFDPTLSVRELKKRCRISDNNISCRFKHEVGISIKEYVETLRLQVAWHLLERDEPSAAEIAQMVGYSYVQTFYRAFKRHYDDRPGEIRSKSLRLTPDSPAGARDD